MELLPNLVSSMGPKEYNFTAKVWLYTGSAAWHLLTVPKQLSKEIKDNFGALAGGWGALPVKVTVGVTRWQTSLFWDNQLGAYILPLKAKVRKQEQIKAHSRVGVGLELLI